MGIREKKKKKGGGERKEKGKARAFRKCASTTTSDKKGKHCNKQTVLSLFERGDAAGEGAMY